MNESTFELYHKQVVDGVYRLDAGTLPDDCLSMPAGHRRGGFVGASL